MLVYVCNLSGFSHTFLVGGQYRVKGLYLEHVGATYTCSSGVVAY